MFDCCVAKRKVKRSRRNAARVAATTLEVVVLLSAIFTFVFLGWTMAHWASKAPTAAARRSKKIDLGAYDDVALASFLADEGLVDGAWPFLVYLRLKHVRQTLRPGSVRVFSRTPPEVLVRQIATGFGRARVRMTVPEGFHRFALAKRAQALGVCSEADFLKASVDRDIRRAFGITGESVEGYLFPDTYEFLEGTSATEVVNLMLAHGRKSVEDVIKANPSCWREFSREGWGRDDLVRLASVVEKEAAVSEERARIAGVFTNRLRSDSFRPKHRLQADPTVAYGCAQEGFRIPSCAGFRGRVSSVMLRDSSNRYNTYRHAGLPPTPISNPGKASLVAALCPEKHGFLYFVVEGKGRHRFSKSLDAHNRAVKRYRDGDN